MFGGEDNQCAFREPGDDVVAGAGGAAGRVDFILQQLDALPTLNAVAVRVIELATAEEFHAGEVIELISADPALASRVLKLCRCTDRVRAKAITTIERAVLHLGFDAVRSAVLSVEIFDFFDKMKSPGGERVEGGGAFDREAFWHHSLAVAVLAEGLVGMTSLERSVTRGEAFLAGLMHDLGLLALHVLLPQSMDRVCLLAESGGMSIDRACSRIIGTTTHTAGKRLAERWGLPRGLGDVIWLHGQRHDTLPELPHRGLITLVSLADAMARMRYITPVGHGGQEERVSGLCDALRLDPVRLEQVVEKLPQAVAERISILGVDNRPDWDLVLRCVSRANQALGRSNTAMRKASALAASQGRALDAIERFHAMQEPGDSVLSVVEKVVRSAMEYLGGGFFAMLLQHDQNVPLGDDRPWQLIQFSGEGHVLRHETITPPLPAASLGHDGFEISDLAESPQLSMQMLSILPWLSDYLIDACDLRQVKLLPLRCGWGVSAVLLHDRATNDAEYKHIGALSRTWAAAIAAGAQHEGARALGEQLADVNRQLVDTQEELARRKALASLGEIAAGAAHEMNNPLAVISGRAQQLVTRIENNQLRAAAELIAAQAHQLSDMISALREFAEPASPRRCEVDLAHLVVEVVRRFELPDRNERKIATVVSEGLPTAFVDPQQVREVLSELLQNAVESKGAQHIEVRVQIEASDDRLRIQVRDDGVGLDAHTLAHAFDPFFSNKPAGRQPGLGLARARRFVEAHGGRLTLENGAHGGAVATIRLSNWRCVEAHGQVEAHAELKSA